MQKVPHFFIMLVGSVRSQIPVQSKPQSYDRIVFIIIPWLVSHPTVIMVLRMTSLPTYHFCHKVCLL